MIIRIANINDIDRILSLEDQIFELHFNARPDWIGKNPKNYEFKKSTIESNDSKIFIAEENNEIIGFCIINIREIKNHHMYHDMTNIEIEKLCIDEKYRQKGIGRKLFEEVKKLAKEKGAKFIELSVWEFNKNAKEFYEHLGMKTRISKMELKI
jgi:ribosomal protein S18 acetylase RimI-like enzyme